MGFGAAVIAGPAVAAVAEDARLAAVVDAAIAIREAVVAGCEQAGPACAAGSGVRELAAHAALATIVPGPQICFAAVIGIPVAVRKEGFALPRAPTLAAGCYRVASRAASLACSTVLHVCHESRLATRSRITIAVRVAAASFASRVAPRLDARDPGRADDRYGNRQRDRHARHFRSLGRRSELDVVGFERGRTARLDKAGERQGGDPGGGNPVPCDSG